MRVEKGLSKERERGEKGKEGDPEYDMLLRVSSGVSLR